MTRLLATIALLVALMGPAKAQWGWPMNQVMQPEMAVIATTLAGYQINCKDLGPTTTSYMAAAAVWVDRALVTEAVLNVRTQIEREGTTAWCGRMERIVDAAEHTPR